MEKFVKILLIAIVAIVALILLAGIVVVLAAVVAAFVFSMSSTTVDSADRTSATIERPFVVGLTVKKTVAGDIIITNTGGSDIARLNSVAVSYRPVSADSAIEITDEASLEKLKLSGGSLTIKADAGTADDASDDPVTPTHIVVCGYFDDGREQVLIETDL